MIRLLFVLSLIALSTTKVLAEYQYDLSNIKDRIYIQSDLIYASSTQIYIKIAEDFIPVQHLSFDGNGFFILIHDIQEGRTRVVTWTCPKKACGYENLDGIDYCGICGTYRYDKPE